MFFIILWLLLSVRLEYIGELLLSADLYVASVLCYLFKSSSVTLRPLVASLRPLTVLMFGHLFLRHFVVYYPLALPGHTLIEGFRLIVQFWICYIMVAITVPHFSSRRDSR